MIDKLDSDCRCSVKLSHDFYLVNNKKKPVGSSYNREDSTIYISFHWYSGKGHNGYSLKDDISNKDSTAIVNNAFQVADMLFRTIQYANYYKAAHIDYYHTTMIDNVKATEDQDKHVEIKKSGKQFILKEFSPAYQYPTK